MNLKPLSNHLFIEPIEEEKTTKSGIVLPETAEKGELLKGIVAAVGPGRIDERGNLIPIAVKSGDTIFFEKPYSPKKIREANKEYWIIDENDILAVIEHFSKIV